MKQKVKNSKLFYARILSFAFLFTLILSLFKCSLALADLKTFTLKDVSVLEKSETATGDVIGNTNNKIDNDLVFHKLYDYVTYKLEIKNNTNREITIQSITDNNNDQHIEYQYDLHENEKVEPNSTFELTIKAIYQNEQTDYTKRNYSNDVDFSINYLDNEGNPDTSDKINSSIILFTASSIGLIISLVYYNKINDKKYSKSFIIVLSMLVLIPVTVKAATFTVAISLESNIGLYDKLVVTRVVDGVEQPLVYSYEDTATGLEEPNIEGYNFLGWEYEDGSAFDPSIPITDDVVIVAKLEKKQYTLIFNNNTDDPSVTGTMENQNGYYGEQISISANKYKRPGYKFMGWNTKQNGSENHYDDKASINLTVEGEINLYAEWIESIATLETGETINGLMAELNANMTEFKKANSKPNLDSITYKVISTTESNFPVYIWNDNSIIYWWSEAEKVYMNSDASAMFYGMTSLINVDFTGLDSSLVTSMDFMFQRCYSLTTMDLRLDTSNVTSMDAMFANCVSLESINFSHIDTSKVENFHGLVAGCTNLTSINLNNFNTESATTFESMFSTLPNLEEVDLSSFYTPNLTSIYFMFLKCANLTTVYATDQIDISEITNSKGPFSSATKIVGGAGTTYSSANVNNKDYFRIDDPDNGKPGYFTLKNARYIRYNGNGADGGEAMTSHYLTTTTPGNLKMNTYTKTNSTFLGWNTEANGSGVSYTNGQLMDTLEVSKTPLTLYAQWEK